jgi:hypothetical protein
MIILEGEQLTGQLKFTGNNKGAEAPKHIYFDVYKM